MPKKIRILKSLPPDCFHRADFSTCPHCEAGMRSNEWDKYTVVLVLAVIQCKHAAAATVAECPKCFKCSWVHIDLKRLSWSDDIYPKAIIEATSKELERRQVAALREWGNGLCWRCKWLESGSVTTATSRHCKAGLGGAEVECEVFEAIKT